MTHDPSTCGCCDPLAGTTPLPELNRPGLRQVRYRVGTYASFLRTMLDRIPRVSVPDAHRPLAAWTSRTPDDPGIALLMMWAYVADILTFYQERFANEAFLRTAVQRESVVWLAALLGYRPSPGAAAQTHVAFTLETGKGVDVPIGLRVQSVPGQGEQPQKFETIEAFRADATLNAMTLRTTAPQLLERGSTTAFFAGTNLELSPGNYVLFVGDERLGSVTSEVWDVRRIDTVDVDRARNLTSISWSEGLGGGTSVPEPPTNVRAYVFRDQGFIFGYNAPLFDLVSGHLPAGTTSWENATVTSPLRLDAIHRELVPGSFVALLTPGNASFSPYVELYRITSAMDTSVAAYTLAGKITQLSLDSTTNLDRFPIRGTQALLRSQQLPLGARPLTDPLTGDTLVLEGTFPLVKRGRRLSIVGTDESGATVAESVIVGDVVIDAAAGTTTITLELALEHVFVRDTVRVLGNVAAVTHGETIHDETLGSGDATLANQDFVVARNPVTFVRDGTAPHGVRSTLDVRVADVRWHEDEELFDHGPNDATFVTRVDVAGKLHVRFGDGSIGARLPTGVDNVVATYRQGLGKGGNVRTDTLTTLLDRPPGLKSARNPSAATGGADPEDGASVRTNAPNGVRTLGRIVSLRDFEDAAREVSGVHHARATWGWSKESYEPEVLLTVLGEGGAVLGADVVASLKAYLAARRDLTRRLRVTMAKPVPITIALTAWVDADHLPEVVHATIRERLGAWVSALHLGEGLHTSRAYAVLSGIEGLRASLVTSFSRASGPPSTAPVLVLQPDELAIVSDPASDITITGASS